MGHLAWDSYEPAEGQFDLGRFDEVMDMMHEADIEVILDIGGRIRTYELRIMGRKNRFQKSCIFNIL
jgi:hypothetical protein